MDNEIVRILIGALFAGLDDNYMMRVIGLWVIISSEV